MTKDQMKDVIDGLNESVADLEQSIINAKEERLKLFQAVKGLRLQAKENLEFTKADGDEPIRANALGTIMALEKFFTFDKNGNVTGYNDEQIAHYAWYALKPLQIKAKAVNE